jgi:transcriptional regulator with XRE-family HTH domain
VRATFKPEFLNRLDEVVVFDALGTDELTRIVDLQVDRLAARLRDRRLALTVTPAAREWLALDGFDPIYGARPLRRWCSRRSVTSWPGALLAGEVRDGDEVSSTSTPRRTPSRSRRCARRSATHEDGCAGEVAGTVEAGGRGVASQRQPPLPRGVSDSAAARWLTSWLMTELATRPDVGALLRDWRQRRRLSQLDLSCEAGVSTRHLSFLETGRAKPSREMVLHLSEQLDVPLRERNALLLAAGFAPAYAERGLEDPQMSPIREAIDLVLAGYEPYPALVVDRAWTLVAANRSVNVLIDGVAPELLAPPTNVLRLSLHPDGLAPRILNLAQWRAHVLHRLGRDAGITGDPRLADLHRELSALPGGSDPSPPNGIAVPLRMCHAGRELAFLSTITTFGTAVDVTAAELSIEAFLPADAQTARAVRDLVDPAD